MPLSASQCSHRLYSVSVNRCLRCWFQLFMSSAVQRSYCVLHCLFFLALSQTMVFTVWLFDLLFPQYRRLMRRVRHDSTHSHQVTRQMSISSFKKWIDWNSVISAVILLELHLYSLSVPALTQSPACKTIIDNNQFVAMSLYNTIQYNIRLIFVVRPPILILFLLWLFSANPFWVSRCGEYEINLSSLQRRESVVEKVHLFLAECRKTWLNQDSFSFVLLYFVLFAFWVVFSLCIFLYCFVWQYLCLVGR